MQIIKRQARKGRTSRYLCFGTDSWLEMLMEIPIHKQNGATLPHGMTCNGNNL
jgi:hypothetical protein